MESESYRDTVRTTRKEERKVVAYVKLGLLLSKLHVKTQNLYFQYWKKESVRQKQREIHFSVLSKHDSGVPARGPCLLLPSAPRNWYDQTRLA